MNTHYKITGRIISSNKRALAALTIEAWDKDLLVNDFLGKATTDKSGGFTMTFDTSAFKGLFDKKPDIFFRIYRKGVLIHSTEKEVIVNAGDDTEVNIALPSEKGKNSRASVSGKVSGKLATAGGDPITATIEVYNVGLRGRVLLTNTKSDEEGSFNVSYKSKGGDQPDIQVVAVEDGEQVASSQVYYDAITDLVVNLVVDKNIYSGQSEYQKLERALAPLLTEKLDEVDTSQLAYLSGKSGSKEGQVADYIKADKQHRSTGIDRSFFYALNKRGLTTDTLVLAQQPDRVLRKAVERAVAENLIPKTSLGDLDKQLGQLYNHASEVHIKEGGKETAIGNAIKASSLNKGQSKRILDAFHQKSGTSGDLWKEIEAEAGLDKKLVEEVKSTLELSHLSANNLGMTKAMKKMAGTADSRIKNLARLDVKDWEGQITKNKIKVPESISGSSPAEKRRNYALSITNRFERLYPSERATAKLIDKNNRNDLGKFLKNRGDFDISRTSVDGYIRENRSELEKEVNNLESLAHDLKKNQRLYKLAPVGNRSEVMDKLDQSGQSSAIGITSDKTQGAFVQEYSENLGGPANAAAVYENAAGIATQVQQVVGGLIATAPNNSPAVVTETVQANSDALDIPDLETLFGSQSYCECQHCKSILSPAAYMVDLLEFLRHSASNDDNQSPLQLLLQRREDLGNIELSCENTNTVLPYIDLVIEILENAVLAHNGQSVDITYQSQGTTQELQAFPENINLAAYDILDQAVYPFILPFHFSNTEGDAYLKKLEVSKFDVMKAIEFNGGVNEPVAIEKAQTNLGLSTSQKKIIAGDLEIGSNTYTVKDMWGANSSNWKSVLAKVKNFLDKTGLSYEELQQLLQVEFINPDGDIIIDFSESDDPCDISQAIIRKSDGTSLAQQFFQRTHRFLRLRQTINWEILELGYTIKAMGNVNLKDPFLERLSIIKELKESTGLDLIELLSWWSNLSTDKDVNDEHSRSYYESLFLNKAISNPLEPDFELNSEGTALAIEDAGTVVPINDHLAHISGALGVSSADLGYLIDELAENPPLTLANLSQLHRLNSLTNAFDIEPKDVSKLFSLIEEDPFAVAQPEGALVFAGKVDKIHSGVLNEGALAYLLLHDYDETDKIGLSEDSIGKSLNVLQEGLQKIVAENDHSSDPTGELTITKLALIADEEAYNDLIALINEQSALSETEQQQLIEDNLIFLDATEAISTLMNIDTTQSEESRVQARYAYLFQPLLDHIVEIQSSERVAQSIADEFDLDLDTSLLLISDLVTSAADSTKPAIDELLDETFTNYEYAEDELISYDLFSAQFDTWILLHKAAMVVSACRLTNDELLWVYENNDAISWLDLNGLPTAYVTDGYEDFDQWTRMSAMCALNDTYRLEDTSTLSLLDMAVNGAEYDTAPTLEDFALGFQELSGWELSDIQFLIGTSAYNLSLADCANGDVLVQLEECLQLTSQVKASTTTLWSWADPDLDSTTASGIRQTVKSHYGISQWLNIAPSLRDPLRQRQRDALAAYLVGQAGYEDKMDLFDHFLIDTEMEACMLTSRIKQANSSLQLFIQRSFMGLEEGVTLDADQKEQWEWMAQYRIWEANRKVFLFPENWLEPELRTSKSEFFKALENELLQDQITDESVERAITRYIEKVDSVSWLEVLGTYHLDTTIDGEEVDVLHVIGRTKSHPHVYYHRKLEKGYWTPWEKLDLEVDSEFVMPVVVNGRLLIFWTKFRETVKEATRLYNEESTAFDPLLEHWGYYTDDQKTAYLEKITDPFVYFDINIGVSEYKYDKWTPGRTSKESFQVGNGAFTILSYFAGDMNKTEMSALRFYAKESGNDAVINCYFQSSGYIGTVALDTDVSVEEIRYDLSTGTFSFEGSDDLDEYALPDTYLSHNKYKLSSGKDFVLHRDAAGITVTVLDSTRGTEIPIHGQHPEYYSQDSLFFQDPYHSFFVTPKETIHIPSTQSKSKAKSRKSEPNEVEYDSVITQMKYKFENFYHPYSSDLMKSLNLSGVSEVMKRETQLWESEYFDTYVPLAVVSPYPKREIDFTYGSAYGIYNWELFYHVPMLIANQLNQDQQFEEAQQWYHYIFNPMDRVTEGVDTPQHFWQFKPFFEEYDLDSVNDLMYALSYSGTDTQTLNKKEEAEAQIEAWKADPFEPHTIAALRKVAYMKNTVLKYIDNLIDWGDSLFKRDTIESINEATQLYILAYKLMGERPEEIPSDEREVYTYSELLEKGIDGFSNALIEIESLIVSGEESGSSSNNTAVTNLYNLYFCIPHNKHLIGYWDTIEDRLFKIRNCMNIDGVVRSLALFEPAIDPGMLVNAKAAGVDLGAVLSDLNAPLPNYRFQFYISRAKEYARDIQSLGSALLSALEKKDAEALALLRSNQEMSLQTSIKELRKLFVDEARENLNAQKQSKITVEKRYKYYKDIVKINAGEKTQMGMTITAGVLQAVSQGIKLGASVTELIPDPETGVIGPIPMAVVGLPGGGKIASSLHKLSGGFDIAASILNTAASITGTVASYQRRWNDWKLQEKLAKSEIKQLEKQIVASEVRLAITEKELVNFEQQMEQAVKYHEFMTDKYTNKELYQWMISQLSSLYFQAYQLAYDCAKRTQKNFQYELNSNQTFIQYGYWNSLKKGLLAGEKLQHDLKRMEMAYLEQNKRGFEITKNISVGLLDPMALINLKQTGTCYVNLPETIFDLDYPGHYQRRIKSVSMTIPCVAGPYTSVSCTLTLMENAVRTENNLDEESLTTYSGATQSIATSNGQQDSGMFQLNFNDERYLPFEGAGAISQWKLQLPTTFHAFDYNTISDVILRVSYTAKDGGETFRSDVNGEIEAAIQAIAMGSGNTGLTKMFSAKHDFANDWYRFLNPADGENHSMDMEIVQERFPQMFKDYEIDIRQMDVYLISAGSDPGFSVAHDTNTGGTNLSGVTDMEGVLAGTVYLNPTDSSPANMTGSTGTWSMEAEPFDSSEITDVILICHYGIQ